MLQVRVHQSQDYNDLPDMDESDVGTLTAFDRACLREVGEYLVRSGMSNRFGISLLHSHFPIGDDEFLVEAADRNARIIRWRPVPRSMYSDDLFAPTNLRFANADDPSVSMVGLEYCALGEFGETAPVNTDDSPVLDGLREILRRHNALERFGIKLVHDALSMDDDEVLLEFSSQSSRLLVCEVTKPLDPVFKTSVETYWRWAPTLGPDGTVLEACGQKCVKACVLVGDKHQSGKHS